MATAAKSIANAMTYVASGLSACLLLGFGFATMHFWGLAKARFDGAGGLPSWNLVTAAQGAFAGILDYPALLATVYGLGWAWLFAVLALCCAIMTVLGTRRAWLRLRDILAA